MMTPARWRWIRATVTVVGAGIALLLQLIWFSHVLSSDDRLDAVWRDWVQFPRTAERVIGDDPLSVYPVDFRDDGRPEIQDGLYFFYPPIMAVATIPLAFFPLLTAYAILVVMVAAVTILAALLLLFALSPERETWPAGLFAFIGSAPWNVAVNLGHLSSLLVLGPALALRAVGRGKFFFGGLASSLLIAKPNLGVPLFLLFLVGRRRDLLLGFLSGCGALVALSLPLGFDLWKDWGATMLSFQPVVTEWTPSWKQVTLFATLQSILEAGVDGERAEHVWAFVAMPIAAWTAWIWWRSGVPRGGFPRLLSLAVLSILTVNPYVYHYDAVLLVIPAFVLWVDPPRRFVARWVCWGALAFTYLWLHAQTWVLQGQAPALTGLGLTVWTVSELIDMSRPARATTP